MKKFKVIIFTYFLLISVFVFGQNNSNAKKIKISGTIIEKSSKQPLEYATITFINTQTSKTVGGGITNAKGEFEVEIISGIYTIKAEFISFKTTEMKNQKLSEATNIGVIALDEGTTQINEVVIQSEKSSVEIKLDKKVYNVGKDMTAKGGTASDVLNNVPSVAVDADGNVSLRGNDNIKILIDGRPSNSVNIASALQTIASDAVDKIEVITNPSARYDAEGGAGIINIILKKGKNNGLNGTVIATVGDPKNYGINTAVNYKNEFINLIGGFGYADRNSPGKGLTDTNYLNSDGTINKTINERSKRSRLQNGINYNLGLDLYIDKSLTWSNNFNYRTTDGKEPEKVTLFNYLPTDSYVQNRFNDRYNVSEDLDFSTNFTKKFKKTGHQLSINRAYNRSVDNDSSIISNYITGLESDITKQSSKNFQTQSKTTAQLDYVLPIGKVSQFETGYKGDFNELLTDYNVANANSNGDFINNPLLTNQLNYKEKINATYAQFGTKYKKLSYQFGLRYEDTNININLLTTQDFRNKKYHNFFPSSFLTYEVNEATSVSLNYSRRINRPRNRFINPFAGYSSNVNVFQGNPDIDPSLTNALDFSVLTKKKKITLTTSLYYNKTKDPFQFIRRKNGDTVTTVINGQTTITDVLLSTPINLDTDDRFGLEFTLNYSPFKWWKLNSNFNFFHSKVSGNNIYTLLNTNQIITENLDKTAFSWFTKLNSKITLPYKIDWQTIVNYTAPQNTAQGKNIGVVFANIALSKDVLKDKATVSLNASDIFNSSKMIRQFNLPTLNSYSEMQRRQRQINLTFTYRFNKQKNDKEKQKKPQENGGGEDF
jgi:outer membrane receptor for ferrienterochelin and colicins